MGPIYRKALVLGATSGIGAALAAKLLACGTRVIVVGRRHDRLDDFVRRHANDASSPAAAGAVTAVAFDVTDLARIPTFAASVVEAHPDLDCVVVNAGVQRAFDFARPDTLRLDALGDELTTNYLAAVHLTAAFLPHLQRQPQGHVVYVGATLGLVPSLVRTPNYNASKAALHAFVMALRQQLKDAGTAHVSVVEVFPPAVQTELHDTRHQPDLVDGGQIGMPLEAFTERLYEGLVRGDEQFAVGPGEDLLAQGGWETQRMAMFETQQAALKESLRKHVRK